ncbi:MAG: hypothetical protein LH465_05740 [Sphingomonas bacterium]|nr:hypothetical protein [Sphingomonas bacterium]
MDLRLPKPIHGWRQFLGEVGIIVLGVMLALGAERVASDLHDRGVAAEATADVSDELNDGLASMALRRTAEQCIDRRFRDLRAIFKAWQETGTFVTPQWVVQTPVIEIPLERYNAAAAAGRLTLLSGEDQYRMGVIVEGLSRFDRIQREERLAWGRLRALQMGPQALGPSDRTMLLEALQDASTLDYEARIDIQQTLPMAREYGFTPDYERIRALAGRTWSSGRYTPSICTPIDTPRDEANKTQVVPLPR